MVEQLPRRFKVGVLLVKDNQTTEEQFFNNCTYMFLFMVMGPYSTPNPLQTHINMGLPVPVAGSPDWEQFLAFLGDRVTLKGWERFAGGLDVKSMSITTPSSSPTMQRKCSSHTL